MLLERLQGRGRGKTYWGEGSLDNVMFLRKWERMIGRFMGGRGTHLLLHRREGGIV